MNETSLKIENEVSTTNPINPELITQLISVKPSENEHPSGYWVLIIESNQDFNNFKPEQHLELPEHENEYE